MNSRRLYWGRYTVNSRWLYRGRYTVNSRWLYRGRYTVNSRWLYRGRYTVNSRWLYRGRYTVTPRRLDRGRQTVTVGMSPRTAPCVLVSTPLGTCSATEEQTVSNPQLLPIPKAGAHESSVTKGVSTRREQPGGLLAALNWSPLTLRPSKRSVIYHKQSGILKRAAHGRGLGRPILAAGRRLPAVPSGSFVARRARPCGCVSVTHAHRRPVSAGYKNASRRPVVVFRQFVSTVTLPSTSRVTMPSNRARNRSMVSSSWTSFERWNSPTASCSSRSSRRPAAASSVLSTSA